ncbi:hypothetical protein MY809_09655, partial [Haemophilus influenzae]|nr:hypothetical protein [Haemophilus influenzae]
MHSPQFSLLYALLISRNFVFMNKLKMALLVVLVSLFACTTIHQPKETVKSRFLKNNRLNKISIINIYT